MEVDRERAVGAGSWRICDNGHQAAHRWAKHEGVWHRNPDSARCLVENKCLAGEAPRCIARNDCLGGRRRDQAVAEERCIPGNVLRRVKGGSQQLTGARRRKAQVRAVSLAS